MNTLQRYLWKKEHDPRPAISSPVAFKMRVLSSKKNFPRVDNFHLGFPVVVLSDHSVDDSTCNCHSISGLVGIFDLRRRLSVSPNEYILSAQADIFSTHILWRFAFSFNKESARLTCHRDYAHTTATALLILMATFLDLVSERKAVKIPSSSDLSNVRRSLPDKSRRSYFSIPLSQNVLSPGM